MMNELPGLPRAGQYLGGHFLLPHEPFVLNSNCGFEPDRDTTGPALVEQNACAVRQMTRFADELRKLNLFDNSMIVIQSDHGKVRVKRPLLLVKYPGAHAGDADRPGRQPPGPDYSGRAELSVQKHLVELIDVVPTLLGILGITLRASDGQPLEGIPLWRNTPGARGRIKVRVIDSSAK